MKGAPLRLSEIKLKPGHVYIHDAEKALHGQLAYLRSIRGDKPVKRWQKNRQNTVGRVLIGRIGRLFPSDAQWPEPWPGDWKAWPENWTEGSAGTVSAPGLQTRSITREAFDKRGEPGARAGVIRTDGSERADIQIDALVLEMENLHKQELEWETRTKRVRLPDISFPHSPPRISSVYCETRRKPIKLGPWQRGVREAFSDPLAPLYPFPEWWWQGWAYRTTCTPVLRIPMWRVPERLPAPWIARREALAAEFGIENLDFMVQDWLNPKIFRRLGDSLTWFDLAPTWHEPLKSERYRFKRHIVIVPKLLTDGEFDLDAAWRPVIKETEERETFWKPSQPARLGGTGENRSRVRRNHVAAEWHALETPLTRCNTLWRAVLRRVCLDALNRSPLSRRPRPGDDFVAWGHTKREYIPTFEDREAARDELLYGIEFADLAALDEDAIRSGAWKWAELNWSQRLKPEAAGPRTKREPRPEGVIAPPKTLPRPLSIPLSRKPAWEPFPHVAGLASADRPSGRTCPACGYGPGWHCLNNDLPKDGKAFKRIRACPLLQPVRYPCKCEGQYPFDPAGGQI